MPLSHPVSAMMAFLSVWKMPNVMCTLDIFAAVRVAQWRCMAMMHDVQPNDWPLPTQQWMYGSKDTIAAAYCDQQPHLMGAVDFSTGQPQKTCPQTTHPHNTATAHASCLCHADMQHHADTSHLLSDRDV